jgi:hexosaminidase
MKGDTIYMNASDEAGLFYAKQTLKQMIEALNLSDVKSCANYRICDYPDLPHRGIMLDISRNFYPMDSVKRVIDIMAMYKLNVLHMHLADDEAWRIEIPGLPALTEVGSRRGYTTTETDCLLPMYSGGWDPNASTTANGYYSREQYIELIQYAKQNNIHVIPEIDMPGHMRACKKAMKGLLTDSVLEKRVYLSAQNYTDNVIAVTNEFAVTFIDRVVTEIVKMHQEAGCELKIFNIGGDEVPTGALTNEEHQSFIDKVMDILARYNLQPMGWEEIGHFCPPHTKAICYSWHNGDTRPLELAQAGYPVVLAAANHLYFDFAYCNHHEEKGLNWGGYTDEYRSFDWTPVKHPNIIGMNAQLWGEVIRSFAQVEWQLYPKIYGLTERAWNNDSKLSLCEYNDIVYNYALPYLQANRHNFHLQQPGIKVENGWVEINAVTPNAKVVYCLHHKDAQHNFENINWVEYNGKFEVDTNEISVIKAKLVYLDHESNVTWEWL